MLRKFLHTDNDIRSLILRLTLGGIIFPHGAQKLLGWFGGRGPAATIQFFEQQLHIPPFVTILVMLAECVGSVLLLLGVFTRLMALGIGIVMIGAIFIVHLPNGFFMNWYGNQEGEGFQFHLMALGIALALILKGGGLWALDGALEKRTGERTLRR